MARRNIEFPAAGAATEEHRLAEQCLSSFYFKHTKLIRFLMKLYSMELVAETTDAGEQKLGPQSLRNVLRLESRPPENRRESSKLRLGQLAWPPRMGPLTTLYLYYMFVKLIPTSILLLKRHLILSHLEPSVQPTVQRTVNGCALNQDLYFSKPADQFEFEQLTSLDSWLKFIGVSMISLPELSITAMFMLAILPLFCRQLFQLVPTLKRLRVDTLCFLLDPIGERRRLGAELRNIARTVILSQLNHEDYLYHGLKNSKTLNDNGELVSGLPRARDNYKSTELAATDSHEAAPVTGRRRGLSSDQAARRLRCPQILFTIKQLQHVNPYIVTSKWHRTLLCRTDFYARMTICFTFTAIAAVSLGSVLYDLCNATRLRLEMVECAKWRLGGTRVVAFDHLYLDELKSAEHFDRYWAYDGSALNFFKLALFVESTSYFSLRRLICWCEDILAGYVLVLEILFSNGLHMASTIEKLVWLNQLNQQVERAAHQAAEHAYLARKYGSTRRDDERLLNTLTTVYLNWELFRRQQHEYLMLVNPFNTCLILFSTMTLLIIHLSGVSLGYSNPLLVFLTCSPILACANLILIASSYRLKRMESIIAKASRMLAHCSSGQLHLSYPVELWRRQVLAFEESGQRYAMRLFAVYIDQKFGISLNIYAIGLLLILLKPQLSALQ